MNPEIVNIYTDGSCHTQKRTGVWASIIVYNGRKVVLSGDENDTTHNRMELLAVIKAIAFIDDEGIIAPLDIYTDSQYVFRIPEREKKLKDKDFITKKGNPVQNSDLIQTLIRQIESHTIHFIKVKAHSKGDDDFIKYNREVDMLARKMVRLLRQAQ